MKPKILVVSHSFGAVEGRRAEVLHKLAGEGHDVEYRSDPFNQGEAAPQFQAAVVGTNKVDAAFLDHLPSLRAVVKFGVGIDNIDVAECTRRGILVGKLPGTNTEAVAEFCLALIMSSARLVPQYDSTIKAGRWDRQVGYDVHGKTLGIVGTGAIGRTLAKFCSGLDMEVLGCDVLKSGDFENACRGRYVSLDELLVAADFVSVHVPLTEGTRGLIGARELALMKPTAFLINAARGGIVDESALLEALNDARIAGAALDVFEHEPPIGEQLILHRRVIATPHVAAYTCDTLDGMEHAAVEAATALATGLDISSAVNADCGGGSRR